jgi:hypothetical protein
VVGALICIVEFGASAIATSSLSLTQLGIVFALEVGRLSLIAALTLVLQLAAGQRALGWVLTAVALCLVWAVQKFSFYGGDLLSLPFLADSSDLVDQWSTNAAGLCRVAWALGMQPVLLLVGAYFWAPAESHMRRSRPKIAVTVFAVACVVATAVSTGMHVASRFDLRAEEQSWKELAANPIDFGSQPQLSQIDAIIDLRDPRGASTVQLSYTLTNPHDTPIADVVFSLAAPWRWADDPCTVGDAMSNWSARRAMFPSMFSMVLVKLWLRNALRSWRPGPCSRQANAGEAIRVGNCV